MVGRHKVMFGATVALLVVAGSPTLAELEGLFGTYVGTAHVEDIPSGETEQRDMDIVIGSHKDTGLVVNWINVSLVDGKRDVPGVTRRVQEVFFTPSSHGNFFEQASAYNPFEEERTDSTPIGGEPVRWATLEGNQLVSYSFVILEDGRYEMQIYSRAVDGDDLTLDFERIVDGETRRVIQGHAIRTN